MHALPSRVEKLTTAQAAQQRASARALLDVERRTLDGARRDLSDTVDGLIAEVGRQPDSDSDASKATILALLLLAGDRLRARLRERAKGARRSARVMALERFGAELSATGQILGASASLSMFTAPQIHLDHAHGSAVANTIAAAWQAGVVYNVTRAMSDGRSVQRAIDDTSHAIDPRLRRMSATEVPQAYNDEHRRAGEDVASRLDDVASEDVGLLVRRWDAVLDLRTCHECRAHDGEVAPLGRAFQSGDEPGFVHPWCRCIDTVIAIPRMRL